MSEPRAVTPLSPEEEAELRAEPVVNRNGSTGNRVDRLLATLAAARSSPAPAEGLDAAIENLLGTPRPTLDAGLEGIVEWELAAQRLRIAYRAYRGEITMCSVPSSVTGQPCLLPEGHPQDSAERFHRYARLSPPVDRDAPREPEDHPDNADAKRRPIQTVGGVPVGEFADAGSEYGRLLAERDRLIASGVDPADLEIPVSPVDPDAPREPA